MSATDTVGVLAGSASTDHDANVYACDIVTLVGVSLAQLEVRVDHVQLVR